MNRYSNEYTDELELWIVDLENQVQELKNEIKKLKRKKSPGEVEQQKEIIEEQKKTIEELRNENTSLLAYKKFFEDMKLRQRELEVRVSEFS